MKGSVTKPMRKRVYEKSWGGRGEHGFRYIDYKVAFGEVTIYLISKDYDDWGGSSNLIADREKKMTFPLAGRSITKEFLYECIQAAGEKLNDTYLLPTSPDELNLS